MHVESHRALFVCVCAYWWYFLHHVAPSLISAAAATAAESPKTRLYIDRVSEYQRKTTINTTKDAIRRAKT